jgi:protein TonB
LGLEPAFSRSTTVVWPLAGLTVLQPEPDDPAFAIPMGSLQIGVRDQSEQATLAGTSSELAPALLEPLNPASTKPGERSRKWKAALVASCFFHAAIAFAFIATGPDEILIEGGDEAGLMLLGNAPEDQSAAGDFIKDADVTKVTIIPLLEAKPVETVEAKPVEPLDEIVRETVQPVKTDAPQPATHPDKVEPLTDEPVQVVATPMPQVLAATSVTPENPKNVVAPVAEATNVKAPEAVEALAMPQPERVAAKAEPDTKPAEKRKPAEAKKPEPAKKAEKKPEKKVAEKTPTKAKTAAGGGGRNQADSRRGVADGDAQGKTAKASKGGRNSSAGNAAVSNYPGKVAAKLRRAVRSISRSARAKASRDVQVSFVVNAGGGVGGVSVVRSSGSSELDQAAVAMVRRAAPFPPIPPEAGRSSWAFTLPLGVR